MSHSGKEGEHAEIRTGQVLVAAPSLLDPNFFRSIVLVCEHGEEGTFGLVLNRPTDVRPEQLLESLAGAGQAVHAGGPVQPDTLHYLHNYGERIPDAIPVNGDVWWGGDFEALQSAVSTLGDAQVSLYLGYAGWGGEQLAEEVAEGSWLLCPVRSDWVFGEQRDSLWRRAMLSMGGEYALLANYPDDPRMN